MKLGNWIPLDKSLAKSLPRDRSFTDLEAMFSISLDYDCGNDATVSGYAARWGWSRNKVRNFLNKIGVKFSYSENTSRKQNQKGQIEIQIRDRSGTDQGQIRIIDSRWMDGEKDRSGTDQGQKKDRSKDSTNNPINPKPKSKLFSENSNEFRLANFLLNHIRKHKPDFKKPNLQTWAKSADLILRVDKRNIDTVKAVIVWTHNDEFWMCNILSMSKLRKQFDTLEMRMNEKPKKKKQPEPEKQRSLQEIAQAMIQNEDGSITIDYTRCDGTGNGNDDTGVSDVGDFSTFYGRGKVIEAPKLDDGLEKPN